MAATTKDFVRQALAIALVLTIAAAARMAATVPTDFSDTLIASVSAPTALAFAPDGRLLITSQTGNLFVVQNGALISTAALNLASKICADNERGLLGVAVDPGFAGNGYLYLYYTFNKPGGCPINVTNVPVHRVSRFTLASNNVVDPGTEMVLIDNIPSTGGYHNGGDLAFGKDGYLYVSVGDGGCSYTGSGNCAGSNDASRDENILLGKILRITADGGIPPTNPFQGANTARCAATGRTTSGNRCQETFAWGLRNPFRIAFDPGAAGTRFFINDVGQNKLDEIDLGAAGADYGWNVREGHCVNDSTTNCGAPPAGMTNPIYDYDHGSGCGAVTGGAFVPAGVWPAQYTGAYLFADYVCGKIFTLKSAGGTTYTSAAFVTNLGGESAVAMKFGPYGSTQALYYTTYGNGGEVRRVTYNGTANNPPVGVATANPTWGAIPLSVHFDGTGSWDPDGDAVTHDWDFGDGTPHGNTPIVDHVYDTAGQRTALLTVRDSKGATATATVIINAGNTPPSPSIQSPTVSTRFRVGQSITLQGSASDAQDGTLADNRLTWTVIRHHSTHTHPFVQPTPGNNVVIQMGAPEDLLAASNSYFEIQLTATDSQGASATISQDLLPNKVDLTFATQPAGLHLDANGTSLTGPQTVVSWESYAVNVNAPAQTDASGQPWIFASWSDGGAASHSIATPLQTATYTATFSPGGSGGALPGLVAAYGFNEGVGASTADATGNGNQGAIAGATWTTGGKFGPALSFNGSSSWVTVADASSLRLTTGLTLEAWINPASLSGWRTVIMKEGSSGMNYALYDDGTGHPNLYIKTSGDVGISGPSTLPANTWSHLAATFDGSMMRVYVNGAQVATRAQSGSIATSSSPLRFGGNAPWKEYFAGLIDEIRIYNRALTAAEIQSDMNTPVASGGPPPPPPPDTTVPAVSMTGPSAPFIAGTVSLTASASDNVGVAGVQFRVNNANYGTEDSSSPYSVSWNTTAISDGPYSLTAVARDAANNSKESAAIAVTVDNTLPSVSITGPPAGSVSASVAVSASATDTSGVASVQFKLDGVNLGAADTTSPYGVTWNTTTAGNGTHQLTALATDLAGNQKLSAAVSVNVTNQGGGGGVTGLVAAYGFNEGLGSQVADASGKGNLGTIAGAVWTTGGKFGQALSFNGTSSRVNIADSSTLDLTTGMTLEAWVNPSALTGWGTIILKEASGDLAYAIYGDTTHANGYIKTGGASGVSATSALPLNAWTHVAVTYDGATLRVFVNGAQVATRAIAGSIVVTTDALRIGGNALWGEYFKGLIDEVRIYNRALTAAEIQTDMTVAIQ